jgi:hypothetical protein
MVKKPHLTITGKVAMDGHEEGAMDDEIPF